MMIKCKLHPGQKKDSIILLTELQFFAKRLHRQDANAKAKLLSDIAKKIPAQQPKLNFNR